MFVKEAQPEDVATVVDVTARGFDDDPVMTWAFRKGDRRSAAIRLFMRTMADYVYVPNGEVYLNSDRTGATMWLAPGASGDITWLNMLRLVPTMIKIAGVSGIPKLLRLQSLLEEKHPDRPHYFLFSVASLPELRGQGIGSAMMEPMTRRFDKEQMPAYLENSRGDNLPFYQKHGFEVTEEIKLPGGGPPMWLMWREPRLIL